MTEQESFKQIDLAIDSFKTTEGYGKDIQVSKATHSDWLVFNQRKLTWTENGIAKLIELYPIFDSKENIAGWKLYAAAYYDSDKKRYYLNKHFTENATIDEIAKDAEMLFSKSYAFLKDIKQAEIPFAVELK